MFVIQSLPGAGAGILMGLVSQILKNLWLELMKQSQRAIWDILNTVILKLLIKLLLLLVTF